MAGPVIFPAIILKSYETGNTSEVLHVVSGALGRFAVYARGLRSPKNRFRALLQPLSLVELSVSMRDESEIGTLREASLLDDHHALVTDLERFTLGLLTSELAAASCHTAQPADEIFAALLKALRLLGPTSGCSAPSGACLGLYGILSAAGYEPGIEAELLRPWPEEKPRPQLFWLDVAHGSIHARGYQPPQPLTWPYHVGRRDPQFPLPPAAVRFLFECARQGEPPALPTGEALQLLEGLIRLGEYHHEGPLRAAGFWRELSG